MLCLFFYVGRSHLRRILFHLLEWTKIHQAIFKTVRISSVLLSFLSIWPLNSISNLLFDLPQSIAYMLHGENYESINLKRMHGSVERVEFFRKLYPRERTKLALKYPNMFHICV